MRKNRYGMSDKSIFKRWKNMISRCYNKKDIVYKYYGARGIKVCKRWHDFKNFFEDMGHPKVGMSLDRIDNSKGYSKSNCRWANASTQNKNRRPAIPSKVERLIVKTMKDRNIKRNSAYIYLRRHDLIVKTFNR